MKLSEIVRLLYLFHVTGTGDPEIGDVTSDSRQVVTGSLFVAMRGDHVDGHNFVLQAVDRGAVAVVVESPCAGVTVPQLVVPSTKRVSGLIANAVYGYPAQAMTMIGVTGTNGKTTTSTLIEQMLIKVGKSTGLIGTIAQRTNRGELRSSSMTTPQAVDLTRVLREMRDLGTDYVVMESSSHALDQGRVAGIPYRVAVFTNLTQDHLDYHHTMEEYGMAKAKLFSRLGNQYTPCADGGLPVAVLNADDPWSARYAAETVQQVMTYGIENAADVTATDVVISAAGATFTMDTFAGSSPVTIRTPGRFSVYNALAAAAAGLALGLSLPVIAEALAEVPGVPGRFERVDAGQPFAILVDYSHTPDSLENALKTVREFCRGNVLTVVGCGGDRDKTKRPIMARVAIRYSDFTVLTSDNPRTEEPEAILDDMEAGIVDSGAAYVRDASRTEGIRKAIARAQAGDVILIAGKGHETYQIIGKTYHDFDDRIVAADIVRGVL